MFGISSEQIIPIANFIGLGLLGILAYFGQRWGKAQPTPTDRTVEVAGALVDSESVRLLAAALEAHTMETIESRKDAERMRQLGHRLVDALNQVGGEIEEIRRAVSDLAKEIARMK